MSEQDPSAPVLDTDRLAELSADLGADGARERLDQLIGDTDRRVSAATAAHEARDAAALVGAAHDVRANALLVGATRLHAAAVALERDARDGAPTDGGVDALTAAWGATRPRLTGPPEGPA